MSFEVPYICKKYSQTDVTDYNLALLICLVLTRLFKLFSHSSYTRFYKLEHNAIFLDLNLKQALRKGEFVGWIVDFLHSNARN